MIDGGWSAVTVLQCRMNSWCLDGDTPTNRSWICSKNLNKLLVHINNCCSMWCLKIARVYKSLRTQLLCSCVVIKVDKMFRGNSERKAQQILIRLMSENACVMTTLYIFFIGHFSHLYYTAEADVKLMREGEAVPRFHVDRKCVRPLTRPNSTLQNHSMIKACGRLSPETGATGHGAKISCSPYLIPLYVIKFKV